MVLGDKGNEWCGVAKIGGAFDLEAPFCVDLYCPGSGVYGRFHYLPFVPFVPKLRPLW